MPTTIALYGDSYISRLQDYCDGDLRVPASIYWCGKGGLRTDFLNRKGVIDKNAKSSYDQLKRLRPDVVIINVGGNDLSTTTKPREIYDHIISLVHDFHQAGVKDVYVAEIMTQGDFTKCPDPQMNKKLFDLQHKKINILLAKELKGKFIDFPDIHYPADYLRDLVNMREYDPTSCNTGQKKYESRLRRVICSLRS